MESSIKHIQNFMDHIPWNASQNQQSIFNGLQFTNALYLVNFHLKISKYGYA